MNKRKKAALGGPRKELRKKVGVRNMRMESLLGDTGIVNDPLEYVEETGRFM